jgi:uncharacterized protein (DUF2267 family)
MTEDSFVAFVQSRAHMAKREEAVAVARAVLNTLAERIEPDDARELAARLPLEIRRFIEREIFAGGQRFSFHEFCQRVGDREPVDPQMAALHARSVFETLEDALTTEDVMRLRSLLPDDYEFLFSPETEDRSRPEPDSHRIGAANPLPRGP